MNHWFLRKNPRRYLRMDMPVHIHITPAIPVENSEISATGFDYFPLSVTQNLSKQRQSIYDWLNKIQTEKSTLRPIFENIINSIELLEEGIKNASKGINPNKNMPYKKKMNEHLKGCKELNALKEKAPNTYHQIKLVEDKILFFMTEFFNNINNSTPKNFQLHQEKKGFFEYDKTINELSDPRFKKNSLVQAILALSTFMDNLIQYYLMFNEDHAIQQDFKRWPLINANLSACGVALISRRKFKKNKGVKIYLSFPESQDKLLLNGSITDIRQLNEHQERIAINFEFPEGKIQDLLIFKVQNYELNQCIKE